MLTKTARDQIIANAFQDEMLKIAAEDAIPGIDWDNLTEEQMEKLANLLLNGLALMLQCNNLIFKAIV